MGKQDKINVEHIGMKIGQAQNNYVLRTLSNDPWNDPKFSLKHSQDDLRNKTKIVIKAEDHQDHYHDTNVYSTDNVLSNNVSSNNVDELLSRKFGTKTLNTNRITELKDRQSTNKYPELTGIRDDLNIRVKIKTSNPPQNVNSSIPIPKDNTIDPLMNHVNTSRTVNTPESMSKYHPDFNNNKTVRGVVDEKIKSVVNSTAIPSVDRGTLGRGGVKDNLHGIPSMQNKIKVKKFDYDI